jgi:tetratricopeptide (TPR) repeat protein
MQWFPRIERALLPGVLVAVISGACSTARPSGAPTLASSSASTPNYEAISFLGDTLRALPLPEATRLRYEQQLAEARAQLARSPESPDALIWVGRRLGYLGRQHEAIATFSEGVRRFPEDARFLRHRGHRYITIRQLDAAIADLERAAQLVEGKPDEIEPDGQPNARNQPIGTLQSNIFYHLGLAYYLRGDFAKALPVYERELRTAKNDDRRVSTAHWNYMTLRRLGRDADAAELVRPFGRDMDVIENQAYHRLILLYKGELPVDSLLSPGDGPMTVTEATAAYGVGNWHLYNGRRAEAERVCRRILAGGQWGAFGYAAAEADLARLRGSR